MEEPSFPSEALEPLGRFAAIAQHLGHAMSYKVITCDTNKIISGSKIRTATSTTDPKQSLVPSDGETSDSRAVLKPKSDNPLPAISASNSNKTFVLTELDKRIGRTVQQDLGMSGSR